MLFRSGGHAWQEVYHQYALDPESKGADLEYLRELLMNIAQQREALDALLSRYSDIETRLLDPHLRLIAVRIALEREFGKQEQLLQAAGIARPRLDEVNPAVEALVDHRHGSGAVGRCVDGMGVDLHAGRDPRTDHRRLQLKTAFSS